MAPNVQFDASDLFILFSWSPPFSLNITDVEPDVLYYSLTVITADNDNPTAIATMNTTDKQFKLQSESCLFEDYQVQIAAVNVVGVGKIYFSPHLHLGGKPTGEGKLIRAASLTSLSVFCFPHQKLLYLLPELH